LTYGLKQICDVEGLPFDELMSELMADSISPGVCRECGLVKEIEQDVTDGYCEDCDTNTVISATELIL